MRVTFLAAFLLLLGACTDPATQAQASTSSVDLSGYWTTTAEGKPLRTFHIGSDRLHEIIYDPIYRIGPQNGAERYQVHVRTLGLTPSEHGPTVALLDGGLEAWRIEVVDDQTIRIGEHRFTRCLQPPPELAAAVAAPVKVQP